MEEQEKTEASEEVQGQTGTEVQDVELPEAQDAPNAGGGGVDLLLDINMPVTVSLGQAQVPVKRLLQLGPGSVLQLDKNIDQPVELYVQEVKYASGEIVVVDGCFAIRIKEIFGM